MTQHNCDAYTMIEHNVKMAQTFQPEALKEVQRCFLSEARTRSIAAARHASKSDCGAPWK